MSDPPADVPGARRLPPPSSETRFPIRSLPAVKMVREVAPEEIASKLESDEDVTVVDIRAAEQFEQGHVPGAINVPLPELPRRVDERDWDADEIVCVCPIGQSSVQAARLLGSYEEIDADAVASMEGGYREWDGDLTADGSARTPTDGAAETATDGAAETTPDGSARTTTDEEATASDEGPQAPF